MCAEAESPDTLGILLPEELVERYGLNEGDVFAIKTSAEGLTLHAIESDLQEQLRAARLGMQKYRVALRNLAE